MPPSLKHTALYGLHRELGARMVPFAGYELPVQYRGIREEHLHTRRHASLFDISHMGRFILMGKNAARALERLVPCRLEDLLPGRQRYTTFLNTHGGIIDDLIVTVDGEALVLVVNAARKDRDREFIEASIGDDIEIRESAEHSLIALQGPDAAAILGRLNNDCTELGFMQAKTVDILGIPCHVSRSGYTGEAGFEIAVPSTHVEFIARRLLDDERTRTAGLGARDTLRLEAGLCLYGHELNEDISPVEAGLKWIISEERLATDAGFFGSDVIQRQLSEGTHRQRVGLLVEGRAPVREDTVLVNMDGETVGRVTSGTYSPTLERPIAMACINSEYTRAGTRLHAIIRNRQHPVTVTKLPFVSRRYYHGPADPDHCIN